MPDYTKSDLQQALADLPLAKGDVVFSHSNLGFFGRPEGVGKADQLCELFADAVFERIGEEGTLTVPTFTYSFPRNEIFDPDTTASNMGMFAEWVRKHPEAYRSIDPSYSIAALGGSARTLTVDAPENSFGAGSFFDRFYRAGGKIMNFNFDAGSTFVHYVERCLDVPYRFDKTFSGTLRLKGEETQAQNTIWVRYLSDDALAAAFEGLDELAREKGLFYTRKLGRGEIGVFSAADTYDLIARTLPHRPWLLTKAEALGVTNPCIAPEESR